MANTDPRNVVFQVDLYWATNGGGLDNPIDVLERYGNRIQLFHVKDMPGPARSPARSRSSARESSSSRRSSPPPRGQIRYYVVEHDPRFGDPTFDPFEAAQKGFDYLRLRHLLRPFPRRVTVMEPAPTSDRRLDIAVRASLAGTRTSFALTGFPLATNGALERPWRTAALALRGQDGSP